VQVQISKAYEKLGVTIRPEAGPGYGINVAKTVVNFEHTTFNRSDRFEGLELSESIHAYPTFCVLI
jgi:hypothetical protein